MKSRLYCPHAKALALLICIFIMTALLSSGCAVARKPAPTVIEEVNRSSGLDPNTLTSPGPLLPMDTNLLTQPPAQTPKIKLDVPGELERMRVTARSMISGIQAKDWAGADRALASLKADWGSYKEKTAASGMMSVQLGSLRGDFAELDRTVRQRSQYDAAMAANKVLLGTMNLMNLYDSSVPFEIGTMEYYVRVIFLASQQQDWISAISASDSALSLWSSIRTTVNASDTKAYSDNLAMLDNAVKNKNTSDTKKYSEILLNETETLRNAYTKAK